MQYSSCTDFAKFTLYLCIIFFLISKTPTRLIFFHLKNLTEQGTNPSFDCLRNFYYVILIYRKQIKFLFIVPLLDVMVLYLFNECCHLSKIAWDEPQPGFHRAGHRRNNFRGMIRIETIKKVHLLQFELNFKLSLLFFVIVR